ncbi:MAG: zinc ABC transporter substrate-binding protein [Pseudomonadota bacterium]
MFNRRTLLAASVAAFALTVAPQDRAQGGEPIEVVATFSILGDMVTRIGGDHVAVTTLVGPDGDAHVYQPTPADARALSDAEVLFVNGLEFEGWIERLVDASEFDGSRIVATDGIEAIPFEEEDDHHGGEEHAEHGEHDDHAEHAEHAEAEHKEGEHGHDEHAEADGHDDHAEAEGHHGHDHGAFDPHAWQSLANGEIYAGNIAAALAAADPDNAATYQANAKAYVAEMQTLDAEILALTEALPEDKRTIVTSHDAFGYFAARYALTFEAPQGLSTESEASAADVAAIISQIREEDISAVFVETITDNRLIEQIARETGARVGGTLYSDALSGVDGPAATYLDMMRHNATTLTQALGS